MNCMLMARVYRRVISSRIHENKKKKMKFCMLCVVYTHYVQLVWVMFTVKNFPINIKIDVPSSV